MKEDVNEVVVDALLERLHTYYGFILVDRKVVWRFWQEFKSTRVDLLFDYIMSQDLADEVEL